MWSFVVCHAPLLPFFAERAPWPVAVVELEEAPDLRMIGQVFAAGDPPWAPEEPSRIRIGTAVHVVFEDCGDVTLPQWQISESP